MEVSVNVLKISLAASFILMAGAALRADTLILKDGRQLEWSSMTDKGESLEIQLATGVKINVKKDDVDRVSFSSKAQSILTGASMTFDKKRKLETFDVLSKIDSSKVLNGTASMKRGVLSISAGPSAHTKLPTGFTPPSEYDLTMVVDRQGPIGEFLVGVVAGGKQIVVSFDAYKSSLSGVMWCDQKGLMDNPDAFRRPVFGKQPKTLTFMVRNEGLIVRIDNQDMTAVTAQSFHRLTEHPLMGVPDKSGLFVACLEGTFSVSQALVTTPK